MIIIHTQYAAARTDRTPVVGGTDRLLTTKSRERYFRMDRRQIGLLRFMLESYEGIASLTTIDAGAGRVVIRIPPGCETEVDILLDELAEKIYMESE